jgi:hypothetical protein
MELIAGFVSSRIPARVAARPRTPSAVVAVLAATRLTVPEAVAPISVETPWSDGSTKTPWGLPCTMNCNAETTALRIQSGGPFVDRNRLSVGCVSSGLAISIFDSWSRFRNNRVTGKQGCPPQVYVRNNDERLLEVSAPQAELDIHSNSFVGEYYPLCASTRRGVTWTGSTKAGTFRNNYVTFQGCTDTVYFAEANAVSDPAVLQNNALNGPFARALDANEGVTLITRIADVNAMSDIVSSGNIIGDSDVAAQWDLGTPTGAPLWDLDGNPRDDTPSIGATER